MWKPDVASGCSLSGRRSRWTCSLSGDGPWRGLGDALAVLVADRLDHAVVVVDGAPLEGAPLAVLLRRRVDGVEERLGRPDLVEALAVLADIEEDVDGELAPVVRRVGAADPGGVAGAQALEELDDLDRERAVALARATRFLAFSAWPSGGAQFAVSLAPLKTASLPATSSAATSTGLATPATGSAITSTPLRPVPPRAACRP